MPCVGDTMMVFQASAVMAGIHSKTVSHGKTLAVA
jgi:hypothetical protein